MTPWRFRSSSALRRCTDGYQGDGERCVERGFGTTEVGERALALDPGLLELEEVIARTGADRITVDGDVVAIDPDVQFLTVQPGRSGLADRETDVGACAVFGVPGERTADELVGCRIVDRAGEDSTAVLDDFEHIADGLRCCGFHAASFRTGPYFYV